MLECNYCDNRAEYVIHDPDRPKNDDIPVCIRCADVFAAGQAAQGATITKGVAKYIKDHEPTGTPREIRTFSGADIIGLLVGLDVVENHKP